MKTLEDQKNSRSNCYSGFREYLHLQMIYFFKTWNLKLVKVHCRSNCWAGFRKQYLMFVILTNYVFYWRDKNSSHLCDPQALARASWFWKNILNAFLSFIYAAFPQKRHNGKEMLHNSTKEKYRAKILFCLPVINP